MTTRDLMNINPKLLLEAALVYERNGAPDRVFAIIDVMRVNAAWAIAASLNGLSDFSESMAQHHEQWIERRLMQADLNATLVFEHGGSSNKRSRLPKHLVSEINNVLDRINWDEPLLQDSDSAQDIEYLQGLLEDLQEKLHH